MRFSLPCLLLLLALAGCSPHAYERVPLALGLPYASRTVTDSQVVIEKDGHTFVFNRGKRHASIDGVLYYLHEPAGMETLNAQDAQILRLAVVEAPPVLPESLTILLDPGHGGTDTGCRHETLHEKSIALEVAQETARRLRGAGHTVLMTRTSDSTTLSLSDRTALAARQPVHAFVSIHVNSAANADAKGAETYTIPAPGCEGTNANSPPRGPMAGQRHIAQATRLALSVQRALGGVEAAPVDRGVKHAHFKVLRDATAPSILVEIGFVTNEEDRGRMADPKRKAELGAAIAEGILAAFQSP